MPLYSRCPQCGKAYAAGDELAGQEVRCRKCGTAFSLPAQDNVSAGLPPMSENMDRPMGGLDASSNANVDESARGEDLPEAAGARVEKFESNMSGGIGSAKSRMERRDDVDEYDLGGATASAATQENPLFDFPMAPELDRMLPRAVIGLMLFWALYQGWSWPQTPADVQPANPAWTGALTAGWLLLLFVAVWLPIVYGGGRRGMSSVRLRIPYRRVQRMAAIASFPFGVASAFWLSGEAIGSAVVGLILGCIPAGGLAYFLLRPNPRQLSSVLTPILVCVAIAAVVSGVLTAGVSAIVGTTLRTYKMQDTFVASPFGPGLSWPEKEVAPPPSLPKPVTPTKPSVTPRVVATQPSSPLVRRQLPLAAAGTFDRALIPTRVDDFVGAMRLAKDDIGVEVYSITAGRAAATVRFPAEANTTAAISSDGRLLARLASFPSLSVQVWSLVENRVIRKFDIAREGDVQIVGFTPDGAVVVQSSHQKRTTGNATVLEGLRVEMMDVVSGTRRIPVNIEGTFSSRIAYASDFSQAAIIIADAANVRMAVVSLMTQDNPRQPVVAMSADLRQVDPALAVQPSAITFSPDGLQIAVVFERDRQVGLMVWKTDGSGGATEHVYPRTLELPEADAVAPRRPMVWLAEPAVCIYGGTAVVNPQTGAYVGTLGLPDVRQMVAAGSDRVIAEVGAAGEPASLLLVDLAVK